MSPRNPKTTRSVRRISRSSTARRASSSSQVSSRHTSDDITSSDTIPSAAAPRRSQRFTARQDYTQTTDAEDDRLMREGLLADLSRHATPSIYNVPKAAASRAAEVPIRHTVIDLTETTAPAGDAHRKRRRAVTQDSSETVDQTCLVVVLKVNPEKLSNLFARLRSKKRRSDHPVLGLEALVDELNEDNAEDARKAFDLVRSSLKRDKDVKSLVDFLTILFAPVKQRIVGKRARLSDDMAQVEQEMRLFQEANGTPEVIKIED